MKGYKNYHIQMTVSLTPVVRWLLITQAAVWLGLVVLWQNIILQNNFIFDVFGLSASGVLFQFRLWQPFTYMFFHASEIWHLLFNSLVIWFVGAELEKIWGAKRFFKYYLVCGVGAGLVYILALWSLVQFFSFNPAHLAIPTVGASGAVFGLLLAYGMIFSERFIYFMFFFPMKAKHFVMLLAGFEVLTLMISGLGGRVNNLAHLGGFVVGFIYIFADGYFQKRFQTKWMRKTNRKLKLVVDNAPSSLKKERKKGEPPTFH